MSTTSTPNANCIICKPPVRLTEIKRPSVFLAGSIDMGKAKDWQKTLTASLSDLNIIVFDPRRDDWNEDWKQDISVPKFKEQVDWEMDHLDKADVIALFLQGDTKSPISLLELGMHAKDGKLIVCCEENFWRRGNVQIVCHRNGIPLVETFEELEELVREKLERIIKERRAESPSPSPSS